MLIPITTKILHTLSWAKVSAAVHDRVDREKRNKNSAENNTAFASTGSDTNIWFETFTFRLL